MFRLTISGLFLFLSSFVEASLVTNGTFDTPFVDAGWDNGAYGATSADIGGDGFLIDDGWVTYDHSTGATFSPAWEVTGGVASRTANTQFQYGGLAQMISNPNDGNFDSGDTLTFSFDYLMNASPVGAFAGGVWGVTAPGGTGAAWNLFAGESIAGLGQSNTVVGPTDFTAGADYQFYSLAYFTDTSQSSTAASHSVDFSLTRDYDYFVVAFQGDPDGDGAGVITVDNVVLENRSLVVIPEPATVGGMWLLLTSLMLRRERRVLRS